jgi:hypothetical protein
MISIYLLTTPSLLSTDGLLTLRAHRDKSYLHTGPLLYKLYVPPRCQGQILPALGRHDIFAPPREILIDGRAARQVRNAARERIAAMTIQFVGDAEGDDIERR